MVVSFFFCDGLIAGFFWVLRWDSDGAGWVGEGLCFFIMGAIVRIGIFEFFIQFILSKAF